MQLKRIKDAEISANCQFVVEKNGRVDLARHFGGNTSNSGLTVWPEWVEEGARAIKPLSLLCNEDLEGDDVICFSGGGHALVRIYSARTNDVKEALIQWNKWRNFEPLEFDHDAPKKEQTEGMPPMRCRLPRQFDSEPSVSTDAQWVARAASFNEHRLVEGARLTNHEVSRHAQNLSVKWDPDSNASRWTATMKLWPWEATALEKNGVPEVWILYQRQETPLADEPLEYKKFIEAQNMLDT